MAAHISFQVIAFRVCALHACNAQRGQKRASEPLELELQMFLSDHWKLGAEVRSSVQTVSARNCQGLWLTLAFTHAQLHTSWLVFFSETSVSSKPLLEAFYISFCSTP